MTHYIPIVVLNLILHEYGNYSLELTDIVVGFTSTSYAASENSNARVFIGVINGTARQGIIATVKLSLADGSASGKLLM